MIVFLIYCNNDATVYITLVISLVATRLKEAVLKETAIVNDVKRVKFI